MMKSSFSNRLKEAMRINGMKQIDIINKSKLLNDTDVKFLKLI